VTQQEAQKLESMVAKNEEPLYVHRSRAPLGSPDDETIDSRPDPTRSILRKDAEVKEAILKAKRIADPFEAKKAPIIDVPLTKEQREVANSNDKTALKALDDATTAKADGLKKVAEEKKVEATAVKTESDQAKKESVATADEKKELSNKAAEATTAK